MNNINASQAEDTLPKFLRILRLILFTYGFYIYIVEYLLNRSLWLDEASLALNILGKSFNELITQPLDYNQIAPIGFLLLTKMMVSLFGQSEFVLRLFPFVCGLGSFFLFYRVSLLCLSQKGALFALFLFVTSAELLRYATEFKPYAGDVFFALLISLGALSSSMKDYNLKKAIAFGLTGAVLIWFSFPAVFMLFGTGVVLIVLAFMKKKTTDVKNLTISFIFWSISFICLYFLSLETVNSSPGITDFWERRTSFMPLPPYTISEQGWFVKKLVDMFYYPGMIQQALIGVVTFVIGSYAFCQKQKTAFFLIIIPLFFVLIASSVHQYPFEGRLILFYVPFLYIVITKGLFWLLTESTYIGKTIGAIFFVSFLYPAFLMVFVVMGRGVLHKEEIKNVLSYVETHRGEGDLFYIYYGADRAVRYYRDVYKFNLKNYIVGIKSRKNWQAYHDDLSQLKGKKRVWVIFEHAYLSHGRSEEQYMLDYLDSMGIRIDSCRFVGASGYLYDLARGPGDGEEGSD